MRSNEKDQAIKDFITETSILRTLKDSKAKNINTLYDAFDFHSQLWIISEYCPGGSVHTLMKANPKGGLEERFIIAIARELAVALKHVHEAGIIHRDVKAANILITEQGQLQLCDFGVSGILESGGKRSTIIGTPFWMAPELFSGGSKEYGTEVDCWAFGATVYELATGLPPNATIKPHMLEQILHTAPRLEGDEYSAGLRQFVSLSLVVNPESRPLMEQIVQHPFLFNTSKKYPTSMLRELLERYYQWEQLGGQRASLFNPYGAAAPSLLDPLSGDDDWEFSISDEFDQDMWKRLSRQPDAHTYSGDDFNDENARSRSASVKSLNPYDKAKEEQRVLRGGLKMRGIFDQSADPYEYSNTEDELEPNDLPLRDLSKNSANRETIIDLDVAHDLSDVPNLDIIDVPTIKAQKMNRFYQEDEEDDLNEQHSNFMTRRLTKDWSFGDALTLPAPENARPKTQDWSMAGAMMEIEMGKPSDEETLLYAPTGSTNLAPGFRPTLKHTVTEPLGNFGDYLHPASSSNISLSLEPPDRASMIDIDIDIDPAYITRPSTAASSSNVSVFTDATNGNPFDLEQTVKTVKQAQRTSFHVHTQSEPTPAEVQFMTRHHRQDSSLSSGSEYDRNRTYSVKQSIDTLRRSVADDYWDKDHVPNHLSHLPLDPQYTPTYPEPDTHIYDGGGWSKYDSVVSEVPMIDLDAPTPRVSDSVTFATMNGNKDLHTTPPSRAPSRGRAFTLESESQDDDILAPMTSTLHPYHHDAGNTYRGVVSQTNGHAANHSFTASQASTTSSFPSSSFSELSPPRSTMMRSSEFSSSLRPGGTVQFPEPVAPDAAALEDEAGTETVVGEVERLLEDFLAGLRVAGDMLAVGGGGIRARAEVPPFGL